MKQTAVDWLCNQIYTIQVELEAGNTKLKNKIEQAKEMEKQQIIDAFEQGQTNEYYLQNRDEILFESAEQYYNETFNK